VLDLRDARVREALGASVDALRAGWSDIAPNAACLRLARQAMAAGADGFIVPSAAKGDGWCIDVLPAGFAKLRLVSRRAVVPAAV
jgi:hypothetical protein